MPLALRKRRTEALDALLAGRPDRAANALDEVLAAHPENLVAVALDEATRAAHEDVASRVAEVIARSPRLVVTPPTSATTRSGRRGPDLGALTPGANHEAGSHASLVRLEASMPQKDIYEGRVGWIPARLPDGRQLNGHLSYDDHDILQYGTELVIFDRHRSLMRVVDIGPEQRKEGCTSALRFECRRSMTSAQVHGGWLYVGHGLRNETRMSAIDLATGEVRFRSSVGVSRVRSVVIRDDYVFTGVPADGGETGRVVVLDAKTGEILVERDVVAPFQGVVAERDRIRFLGLRADHELPVSPLARPRPEPFVGLEPVATVSADALATPTRLGGAMRCRLLQQIEALDHGAPTPTGRAPVPVAKAPPGPEWFDVLRGVFQRAVRGQRWPLTQAPTVVAPLPPATRPERGAAPFRLRLLSLPTHSGYTLESWLKKVGASTYPRRVLPRARHRYLDRPRVGPTEPRAPAFFGRHPLSNLWVFDDHTTLLYGNRYVVVVDTSTNWRTLDVAALLKPFVHGELDEPIVWAQRVGDDVLVELGTGARAPHSLVSVAPDGSIRFNTGPVSRTGFVVHDGYVISALHSLDQPSFVYVTSPEDGTVRGRTRLNHGPDDLLVHDGKLHVRAGERGIVFEILGSP
ncbi:MAG: hypothetical protein AAF928_08580 [Myxococcota bacterium]